MPTRVLRSNKRRLFLLEGQDTPVAEPQVSKKQKNNRSRSRQVAAGTSDSADSTATHHVSGSLAKMLQEPEVLHCIAKNLWVRDIKSLVLTCRAWEKIWTPYIYRTVGIQQQSVWSLKKAYPQLDRFGHMVEKLHFNNFRTKIHGAITALRSTQCSGRLIDLHIPSFHSHSRGTYARIIGPELQSVRTLRITLNDYEVIFQYNDLMQRVNTLPHLTTLTLDECSHDMLVPMLRFLRDNKTVRRLRIQNVRIRNYLVSRNGVQRPQNCLSVPADLAELDVCPKRNGEGEVLPQALWQNTNIVDLNIHCEMLSNIAQRFTQTAEFVHPDVRAFFGRLPNLQKCQMEWSLALKLSDFQYVAKTSLTNVTELKILRCYMVSMLPILTKTCPLLKSLYIQNLNNHTHTAADLPGSFVEWKDLEFLKIDGDLVSDRQMEEIAQSTRMSQTLKQLQLRMCRHVTGNTVRQLLERFDQLQVLHLLLMNTDITTIFETGKPWASYRTLKVLVVELFGNGVTPTFPRPQDKQFMPSVATQFHVRRQLHALQALELLILYGSQFTWEMLNPWPTLEEVALEGDEWMRRSLISRDSTRKIARSRAKGKAKASSIPYSLAPTSSLLRRVTRASASSSQSSSSSSAHDVSNTAPDSPAATQAQTSDPLTPTSPKYFAYLTKAMPAMLNFAMQAGKQRDNAGNDDEISIFDTIDADEEVTRLREAVVRSVDFDFARLHQEVNTAGGGPLGEDERKILLDNYRLACKLQFQMMYAKHLSEDAGWAPWMNWMDGAKRGEEQVEGDSLTNNTEGWPQIDVAAVSKPVLVRARLLEAGALRDGASRDVVEDSKKAFEEWYQMMDLEQQFMRSHHWARMIMRTRIKDSNLHVVREYSEHLTGPSRQWPMVVDFVG
ncbi:hypothetical protein BGZ73_006216 [Actinomortierella ambigua]|nr:hypothetical protein BGZ73_006216 [Actinomortierella ambigua]